jgi:CO/xanthine dehydrogenase Mo-binding subunit
MSIGQSVHRVDSLAKVRGEALFSGDFNLPNQAYAKILFSSFPHAIIRDVEIEQARKIDGVIAIFTAQDVPVNEYGLIYPDQPVFCGPGSKKQFADHVRFIGDQIAIVIAETEEIASKAIKKIKVDYEQLEIIPNINKAIDPDAIVIHPDRGTNILEHKKIRKGDLESGFSQAAVIIESDYFTPAQEHAYLQPEAGIAYLDEEQRITVVVAGQWAHEEQEQIAHALDLPVEKVRVIHPAIGGAFGGREDISIQIALGVAVMRMDEMGIRRPVKLIWSREESIIGHGKRHPYQMKAKWGADLHGQLVAAEIELFADAGAYAYTSTKVLGNAILMCTGPYYFPNVKVDAYAVYTNNIPGAAFRGFGGPQGAFLAEMQMNKLAAALKIDPVELRMRNLLDEEKLTSMQTPLPKGVTIDKVVEDCAEAAGWEKTKDGWIAHSIAKPVSSKSYLRRGKGFACAFKNIGFSYGAPESCDAIVELHGKAEIDYVIVRHAGSDVGQGAHTVFAQVAAQSLNLPMNKIRLVVGDTAETQNSGSASASRMTFMAGNAIIGAAKQALHKWEMEERPAIASFTYRPPATTAMDPETGAAMPNFTYGYVAEAVEIEVDIQTGELKILNIICSDDVGKAINTQQVIGQIEGAVVQAAGYAVLENFIQLDGKVLTDKLSTYLIPTVLDIPGQIESRVLEYADPIGPFGARGMGELPYLPFAPALASALFDATGTWFNTFPFTAEHISTTLNPFPD